MEISRIGLVNFRNYEQEEFHFSSGLNLILGANAAGKTNLLESIYYLAGARSWRCQKETEMIHFGSDFARISADITSGQRKTTLQAELTKKGRRQLLAGGVKLTSPRELLGRLPSVLFAPEDLQLLRGGPVQRRRFMDMALSQLYVRYVKLLSGYRRLHAAKTHILKRGDENLFSVLPDYHRHMAVLSVEISEFRANFVQSISELAGHLHKSFASQEHLKLTYTTQVKIGINAVEELILHMEKRLPVERKQGVCLVGIHRDDITAELNDRPVRDFASQGQTRTAAIAMKLAERDYLCAELGEPPLLLLDDVLSELDENRQGLLLESVKNEQVFLTCCNQSGLLSSIKGKTIQIRK